MSVIHTLYRKIEEEKHSLAEIDNFQRGEVWRCSGCEACKLISPRYTHKNRLTKIETVHKTKSCIAFKCLMI